MKYEWKKSNEQPYLYVEADNRYELGVALGKGLHQQITATQHLVNNLLMNTAGTPAEKLFNKNILINMMTEYMKFVPDQDMEEIKGMYEGYSTVTEMDITLEDIQVQSVLINIIYQFMAVMPPGMSLEGCTNFGIVNPNGPTVHGQNYDADGRMTACNAFVHHKVNGEPEVFLYRMGADLGTAVGKNEHGVCMTVSVLQSNVKASIMTPRGVLVREAMRQDNARSAMDAMVDNEGRSPFSYNLIISDEKVVIASQATPYEQRISYVKQQIVQSNQYDYYDWIQYLKKPSYSKRRQLHSEQLLTSFFNRYGSVDNEDLLEILRDKPVICRQTVDDGLGTTVLFLTRKSFGHGNPSDTPIGEIPL